MFNKIKDAVQNMDFFAARPSLRLRQKPYSGSKGLGIFSLMVIGFLAAMLYSRIKNTLNLKKSQITFNYAEQRTSQGGEINGLMFGVGFDLYYYHHNMSEFQRYLSIYVKYFSKEEQKMKLEVLKPCRLEQWVNLGQNYQYWFYQYYYLNQSYCPERPLNITVQDLDQKFFTFYFSECDPNLTNNSCDGSYSNYQKQNHQIYQVQICFLTKSIRISYPNPEGYDVSLFYFDIQDTKQTKKTKLYFGQLDRYTISNDESLISFMPTSQDIEGFSFVNSIHSINIYKPLSPRIFIEYNLELSQRVVAWTRSRSKIDVILSDIGGLQQIIVLALFLFLKSYDEIKYELTIAGSSFNYNTDGYKIRRQDLNVWTYVKYLIFRFVKQLCCYELPLKSSKQMMETLEQGNQILDVKTLFRRLEFLQKAVQQKIDNNQVKILSIINRSVLQQVKNQRLMISYYESIIKLKEAATVEDAMAQTPESFEYLNNRSSILSFESHQDIKNSVDKTQIKLRKKEIEQSLRNDLKLDRQICEAISEYPQIVEQALSIQLNEQKAQTEKKIAKHFLSLNNREKRNLIMKIPIIFLHRIRFRTIELNLNKTELDGATSSKKETDISVIKIQDQKQTTRKKIKKVIKETLTFSDFFSCQPFLRSDRRPEKSTGCFGFFDFLIILVFTYVGTVLLKKLFQFDSSQLTIYTYQDTSIEQKNITNVMFAFKFPTVNLSDKLNYTFDTSSFFTINYTLNLNNRTNEKSMVHCNPQNWILLGQNYYERFTQQQLGTAYCLPNLLNLTIDDFMIEARIFFDCWKTKDQECDYFGMYYQRVIRQQLNFPIDVYILAPLISADQQDPITYTLVKQRISLPENNSGVFYQQYSGRQIITDRSIWPFIAKEDVIKTYVPDNNYLYSYQAQNYVSNTLYSFYCRGDVQVTERKIDKLDQILSYLGGLFGIFVSFFGIFFLSFNKYRFETNVGENSFNFDTDGKKFSERDLTTVEYVKYTIFKWLREICCQELKWKNSKKISRTLEEVEELLDVEKLFKRLQYLQRVIYQYAGKQFLTVMALVEHDSLQEIKQKRMVLQYYNLIVQHKPAASVEDAINQKQEAFSYLKSTTNKNHKSFSYLKNTKVAAPDQARQSMKSTKYKKKELEKKDRRIEQMKKSFRQDLKLDDKVCKALVWYPEIADQAQEINLGYEWHQIQEQITLAFLTLSPQKKYQIIQKIPIIIMHRMRMKSKKMKELSKFLFKVHQQEEQDQKLIRQFMDLEQIQKQRSSLPNIKRINSTKT